MTSHEIGGEEARRVADSVLAYLDHNPQASDTLDGISQWWLPQDKSISREVLVRILERLVAEGRLEKCELLNGHCLWRKPRAA